MSRRRRLEIEYVSTTVIAVRGPGAKDLIGEVRPTKIGPDWDAKRTAWTTHAIFAADMEVLAASRGYAVSIVGAPVVRRSGIPDVAEESSTVAPETQAVLW